MEDDSKEVDGILVNARESPSHIDQLCPDDPLVLLGLSIRPYNALMRHGVNTVGQLVRLVRSGDALKVRNFGKLALAEVEARIAALTPEFDLALHNGTAEGYLPQDCPIVYANDPLRVLDLSTRPYNALRRSGLSTVGELADLAEAGCLHTVRNIGELSKNEVERRLASMIVKHGSRPLPGEPAAATRPSPSPSELEEAFSQEAEHHRSDVKEQISVGLLHPAALVLGKPLDHWLSTRRRKGDLWKANKAMALALESSRTVCEELEFLLAGIRPRDRTVLLARAGLNRRTLQELGDELDLSRERIRQIASRTAQKVGSRASLPDRQPLVRCQSALLLAADMAKGVTLNRWAGEIRASGLVGRWADSAWAAADPVEALVAICSIVGAKRPAALRMPPNLVAAAKRKRAGAEDTWQLLPKTMRSLIRRHTRHCGAVHSRWLSQEMNVHERQVAAVLSDLGYQRVQGNWYAPPKRRESKSITRDHVLDKAVEKMVQHCGPVNVNTICGGIRAAISRTSFPTPPPSVMERILDQRGYTCEYGFYVADSDRDYPLSQGERVVMTCLEELGPVVSHSELASAFLDSPLSFPSLHPTLRTSPLFERIDRGLYKLRGRPVTDSDVERAERTLEKVASDLEIAYDTSGNLTVSLTLGRLSAYTGSISGGRLPNLSGLWECVVEGEACGAVEALDGEIRQLEDAFERLDCSAGDRLKLVFNTWERTVAIEKGTDTSAN
jgi:hypothetical protein